MRHYKKIDNKKKAIKIQLHPDLIQLLNTRRFALAEKRGGPVLSLGKYIEYVLMRAKT